MTIASTSGWKAVSPHIASMTEAVLAVRLAHEESNALGVSANIKMAMTMARMWKSIMS